MTAPSPQELRRMHLRAVRAKVERGERLSRQERSTLAADECERAWADIRAKIKTDGSSAASRVLAHLYALSIIHAEKREVLEDRIAALEAKLTTRTAPAKPRVRRQALTRVPT
jgi:hypothetical protein